MYRLLFINFSSLDNVINQNNYECPEEERNYPTYCCIKSDRAKQERKSRSPFQDDIRNMCTRFRSKINFENHIK